MLSLTAGEVVDKRGGTNPITWKLNQKRFRCLNARQNMPQCRANKITKHIKHFPSLAKGPMQQHNHQQKSQDWQDGLFVSQLLFCSSLRSNPVLETVICECSRLHDSHVAVQNSFLGVPSSVHANVFASRSAQSLGKKMSTAV